MLPCYCNNYAITPTRGFQADHHASLALPGVNRSPRFSARKPGHIEPARQPPSKEGMMELLIGFVATLFISLLIFRK
jgi:hypothetical protein